MDASPSETVRNSLRPIERPEASSPEEQPTTVAPTMAAERVAPSAGDDNDETRSEGPPAGQITDLGGHDLDDTRHALSPAKNLERDDEDETVPSQPSASASKFGTGISGPSKPSRRIPVPEERAGPEEKENRAPKRSCDGDSEDEQGVKMFEKRRRLG